MTFCIEKKPRLNLKDWKITSTYLLQFILESEMHPQLNEIERKNEKNHLFQAMQVLLILSKL